MSDLLNNERELFLHIWKIFTEDGSEAVDRYVKSSQVKWDLAAVCGHMEQACLSRPEEKLQSDKHAERCKMWADIWAPGFIRIIGLERKTIPAKEPNEPLFDWPKVS